MVWVQNIISSKVSKYYSITIGFKILQNITLVQLLVPSNMSRVQNVTLVGYYDNIFSRQRLGFKILLSRKENGLKILL